ncbi:MAG: hypothetical protein COX62_06850 [Deltaproteobacteria bacterium CG_4_10_14_0_2_um_filter_43_8]|nr:MAG: hypothetical protein COV43_02530 [Deltaproteobacteria bacterium CG11_big_fil_rev_8_21_14_0_20_42_23]PJA19401.1 MAG: hypothetical protein COX62_06850 [Deltaproteobacteria bacterium CG_4_10_14_0_2_um_filter_43_8]PJC64968.1 MAG: hypothetical protein CO021_01545 [Deltaproteobacteria bacterium CG_4_9_14_0_2_um_filter_42_21]
MSQIALGNLTANVAADWDVQGMLTITLPSTDPNVKPNVILTKEQLPREVDLNEYFDKIKESIQKRGIKDLKISDERDIAISGVRGKMMICSWDVSAMAEMMAQQNPNQKAPAIKPGQIVKQVQVTLLKDQMAINMTASFPNEKFTDYYKPFQEFLKSLKFD